MTARTILAEVNDLKKAYANRDSAFTRWFRLLHQVDEFHQEDMESFVGNDPRTLWNMGNFLLQPKPLTHSIRRVDQLPLDAETKFFASMIERRISRVWIDKDKSFMRQGGGTWFWEMIGSLLATGWYAIPFRLDSNAFFVSMWEPIQTYPEFGDETEGLVRLARVRKTSWPDAIRRVQAMGIDINEHRHRKGDVTEYQLWKDTDQGITWAMVIGEQEITNELTTFKSIPILIGGVGGIPANISEGRLLGGAKQASGGPPIDPTRAGDQGRRTVKGQSILATNEQVYWNFNKQQTFMQQLLRDTANPKTWEKGEGNTKIIKSPEEWFARGAHFKMGLNDDVGVFPQPGIPVELSQMQFSLRNQMQRGGFSDVTFGNITAEVTSTLLAQTSEAARQILTPYHEAVQYIVSTISDFWFQAILENPTTYKALLTDQELVALEGLKEVGDLVFESAYSVKVPGDLSQRLAQAKAASPTWELSAETAYELFFPEVTDINNEMGSVQAEKARITDPVFQLINSIKALRAASEQLKEADPTLSELYAQAAEIKLKQISSPPPEALPPGGAPPVQGAPGVQDINGFESVAGNLGGSNGRTP